MTRKQTARPICEIYRVLDDGSSENLGTLFQWNTGEKEMRWQIDPATFQGGQLARVPVTSSITAAIAAAGAA